MVYRGHSFIPHLEPARSKYRYPDVCVCCVPFFCFVFFSPVGDTFFFSFSGLFHTAQPPPRRKPGGGTRRALVGGAPVRAEGQKTPPGPRAPVQPSTGRLKRCGHFAFMKPPLTICHLPPPPPPFSTIFRLVSGEWLFLSAKMQKWTPPSTRQAMFRCFSCIRIPAKPKTNRKPKQTQQSNN